jgi:hypothetical protein
MLRRDYILRAIEELARAMAAIAGLRKASQPEQALRAVEEAKARLPLVPGILDRLTPDSLRQMLTESGLLPQVVELYQQEAELCYVLGMKGRAVRCAARAEALRREQGPQPPEVREN